MTPKLSAPRVAAPIGRVALVGLAAALLACNSPAFAGEVAKAPDPAKQGTGTMERPSPPAELQKIKMWEGEWIGDSHILATALGPESRTKSNHRFHATLGGMHLEGEHDFTVAGAPVHGQSIWSWNPETKQYQVVWHDNTNPMPFVYSGQFQDEKTLVVTSAYPQQGKVITERITYVLETPDRFTLKLENNMVGAMTLLVEETMTRTAPATKQAKRR